MKCNGLEFKTSVWSQTQMVTYRNISRNVYVYPYKCIWAFQVAPVVKNPPAHSGRLDPDPWVENTPWRRKWKPIAVFLPGESHGQRNLQATVHRAAQSWTSLKQLSMHWCISVYMHICIYVGMPIHTHLQLYINIFPSDSQEGLEAMTTQYQQAYLVPKSMFLVLFSNKFLGEIAVSKTKEGKTHGVLHGVSEC